MAPFADHAAAMDAHVDAGVGDSIFYQRPGDPAPVEKFAFIIRDQDNAAGPMDSAMGRVFLKITKTALPAKPARDDRVTSAQLDGAYRPMNTVTADGGRQWLSELQKV